MDTISKSSVIKHSDCYYGVYKVTSFEFNGAEFSSLNEFKAALTEWPAVWYDFTYDTTTKSIVVSSYEVGNVQRLYNAHDEAYGIDFQYTVPGNLEIDQCKMTWKEICPLAVNLGFIDDYTSDQEVIFTSDQEGYFSCQDGEWKELPTIRRKADFAQWLADLDYSELEEIAKEYAKRVLCSWESSSK